MKILQNRLFVLLTLTLSSLYFVITGVQYWISSYLQVVLLIPESQVYKFYVFTCFTAPLLGVIIGGVTFSNLGGYKSQKSFGLCVIIGLLAALTSLPIPFLTNFKMTFTCIWFVFFFGSAIVPTLTGILLNMVDQELRTTAMSAATLAYNMLGYLPAPLIYGVVSDLPLGNKVLQQRLALASVLYMSIASTTFLISAFIIKYRVCKRKLSLDEIVEKPMNEWHAHGYEEVDSEFEPDIKSG